MPSFDQHVTQSANNIEFLNFFMLKTSNDWAMTVMFYTSVHICEALINKEVNRLLKLPEKCTFDIHCTTHDNRDRQLKELFPKIHKNWSELRKCAHDGRYKVYNFREMEVRFRYNRDLKPIVEYFNKYCLDNKLENKLTLKDIPIKLTA